MVKELKIFCNNCSKRIDYIISDNTQDNFYWHVYPVRGKYRTLGEMFIEELDEAEDYCDECFKVMKEALNNEGT